MNRKHASSIVAVALLFAAGQGAALAQSSVNARHGARQKVPAPASDSDLCRAWCDRDESPCDPLYYKVADGRCKGLNRR